MRLFLGLTLPRDIRTRLAGLCSGVPGARWVSPENLHLTLRFIGEVEEETAREVTIYVSRIRHVPFDLTCKGVGYFGSRRRVRSLWVGVKPSSPLMVLQKKIETLLQRAGLAPERRNFTPHITLARFKSGACERLGNYLSGNALITAGPFIVDGVVLFSSCLGATGATYRIEEVFPLA
jgi:2'-5' RNA ligase